MSSHDEVVHPSSAFYGAPPSQDQNIGKLCYFSIFDKCNMESAHLL